MSEYPEIGDFCKSRDGFVVICTGIDEGYETFEGTVLIANDEYKAGYHTWGWALHAFDKVNLELNELD